MLQCSDAQLPQSCTGPDLQSSQQKACASREATASSAQASCKTPAVAAGEVCANNEITARPIISQRPTAKDTAAAEDTADAEDTANAKNTETAKDSAGGRFTEDNGKSSVTGASEGRTAGYEANGSLNGSPSQANPRQQSAKDTAAARGDRIVNCNGKSKVNDASEERDASSDASVSPSQSTLQQPTAKDIATAAGDRLQYIFDTLAT